MSLAAADFSQVPMSQHLAATLARASDAAGAWAASEVSLEHVLLALCDDPDAEAVLTASRVDVARLKSETAGYLNSLPRADTGASLAVSPALSRILEAAAAAARGGRRRDINGAIVLAAIVGDGKSVSAQILQAQGLTFDEAIRALQAALAPPPREALPDIRPTDDVLARARERVQSRSAPSLREIMNDLPRQPTPPPAPAPAPAQLPPQPQPAEEGAAVAPAAPLRESAAEAPKPSLEDRAVPADGHEQPSGERRPEDVIESRLEPVFEHREIEPPPPAPQVPSQSEQSPWPSLEAAGHTPSSHGSSPEGYVYPQSGALSEPRFGPQSGHAPAPVAPPFDFGRPVPIATPPPIPPALPLPQAAPNFGLPPPDAFGQDRSGQPYPDGARAARLPQPPPAAQYPSDPASYPPMSPYGPAGAVGQPGPFGPPGSLGHPGASGQAGPFGPTGGATAPPQPAPMSMPAPVTGGAQPKQQRAARPKTESGQLAENIPRAMRAGVTERIEVRIGKAAAKKITEGLEGGGVAWRHEVTITQAMSVRLRAPDGGFFIETVSPETQWIENNIGLGNDDFASWRFQVTPQERGWARLQIVVSARTIGNDGMAAETALPDQIVDVKIRTNYKQTLARWGGWTLAAIVGGAFAKFGEGGLGLVSTIVEKLIK